MKKILINSFLLTIIFGLATLFSSCQKCSQCVIKDGGDNVVTYDQFCGSSSEVKAFNEDVAYDADKLQCISCIIMMPDRITILKNYEDIYGTEEELEEFVELVQRRAEDENAVYECSEVRREFGQAVCN